ncbi:TPA: hypothetical protein DEG21_01565 [Patescibacteria group bacterium]|nr:hypothetical protein [Candidatus Gracilibacteria bacterium]HBY74578.1 hypothetical protein [Candidatus Gracilibacteria bacterium]
MKNINIIISIFVLVIILGGFYVISKKTIDYFNNTRYSYELTKLDSTKMVLDSNYYFDKSKNLIYWQHNSL